MNDYGFWVGFCDFFKMFGKFNFDLAITGLGFLTAILLVVIPISCLIEGILWWFTEGGHRGEDEEEEEVNKSLDN
jgi:hypothetical protein